MEALKQITYFIFYFIIFNVASHYFFNNITLLKDYQNDKNLKSLIMIVISIIIAQITGIYLFSFIQ